MPICPHCRTVVESAFVPCPNQDGYHTIPERDFQAFKGDRFLGKQVAQRYIIYSVIGHGSIGRVYKARQESIGRDVVLKIFKLESLVDEQMGYAPGKTIVAAREDARERFRREAQVLGRLDHPNCVTVYDFGVSEDGSFLYIAMEHVAGMSMRQAVQRGLKSGAMVDIMRQILMALRQAHRIGIVHRDLKPENILLTFRAESGEPVVKVLDFGIAKLVGSDVANKTGAGMLFGTPAYMSPEQCRGASDEVGPASDIYALGCLFYELATGELPFKAATPHKLLMQHLESPIPEVVTRSALTLPLGTGPFIQKCLSKAPEDRYSDAGAALKILEGLTEDWVPPEGGRLVAESTAPEIQALREGDTAEIGPEALAAALHGVDEAAARRAEVELSLIHI